ncbi:MAG: Bug family tripartite tricarboxylate transporter substrate binding protein [Gemmatimonas sp.]
MVVIARIACAVCVASVATISAGTAIGQSLDSFYRSNGLKFIVAAGAGGGYDVYGRALARHIGAHLPGNPSVVAQNMPGADGLKATNFIYNVAPKDGSVIGNTYATMTLQPLLTSQGIQFDPLKLNWLGSMGKQNALCVTWTTSPIKTIEDARITVTTVSSTGAAGSRTTVPKILNAVLGTKFKVITGYDTAGASLAVERGEVDGLCGVSYATLMASNPHWLLNRKVNVLVQLAREKDPHVPSTPMALDMVEDANDRRLLDLILVVQEVGRPVIAPPDVSADRLTALQKAFADTMVDPAFAADAERLKLEIDPLDYRAIVSLLAAAYASPKDVVTRASQLLSVAE